MKLVFFDTDNPEKPLDIWYIVEIMPQMNDYIAVKGQLCEIMQIYHIDRFESYITIKILGKHAWTQRWEMKNGIDIKEIVNQ